MTLATQLFSHWFLASSHISTLHPVYCESFGRYNIHAKIFRWLMTIYPIVTALTGFQFVNLLPYLLQVLSTLSGYYKGAKAWASQK
ncbi:hypothetical protein DSO57_1012885 [Entomophthora muscae]|uniref:Uncharacterized protein n=1 Tax=Entomophthora muscae TaxID=34485 RepID=A0ACC2TTK3_9FUNG|nr:hypothetical protein DSO57_1012885 [Entomophthora muscae]